MSRVKTVVLRKKSHSSDYHLHVRDLPLLSLMVESWWPTWPANLHPWIAEPWWKLTSWVIQHAVVEREHYYQYVGNVSQEQAEEMYSGKFKIFRGTR